MFFSHTFRIIYFDNPSETSSSDGQQNGHFIHELPAVFKLPLTLHIGHFTHDLHGLLSFPQNVFSNYRFKCIKLSLSNHIVLLHDLKDWIVRIHKLFKLQWRDCPQKAQWSNSNFRECSNLPMPLPSYCMVTCYIATFECLRCQMFVFVFVFFSIWHWWTLFTMLWNYESTWNWY